MAPADASSSKTQNSLKLDEKTTEQKPAQPQLSGLEEDDEFEEFAVQGMFPLIAFHGRSLSLMFSLPGC